MERRDFIKISGAGALALGAAAVGCAPKKKTAPAAAAEEGPEQMVYRENPVNGDKVSLIGFGCMRWPMVEKDGKRVIDQEAVNEMVDYALEHGINYFDTSPAYLMGQSEKAAGIALSRHPRDKYFIATKLSNFNNQTPEASIQMYRDSFDQLKTDYFDYYLLHSIGSGGVEAFRKRYVDNGMMEFLIKEKEAGRIRNLGFSFHGSPSDFDSLIALHDNGEYHWDFVQIEMNYVDWNHADGRRNANASYLYEELDKRGIPIVIMEPLLGGRLANVPDAIAQQMKEREPDKSIASWAFRFCGTHPRVLCALSGMTNMDPLLDNIKTQADKQIGKRTNEQTNKRTDEQTNNKMSDHKEKILEYLGSVEDASSSDIAKVLGLSQSRIRLILSEMDEDVESIGATNKRRYRKK